ncbi:DUF3108 domain-containing protein [Massilia horti]|uniref:DUF3108 domain-containing protein n=1 Tax=Massilia horti TaxID=2562153 RepID=A0A4Y9T5B7_9BURK|nr:DUF3108 domain-containing protein [Massilia horti]TFW36158.1 hypothetical protein E4O92_00185 [Massilia horti]
MRISVSRSLLVAIAAVVSLHANAAVQNVDVGMQLPRFALLKEGTHRYLRYVKSGDANTPNDIWTRTVRFEERDGKKLLHIYQRWDGSGPTPGTLLLDSWFDTGTFRPHTHQRIREKDGKRVVEGFVFAPDRITGMKDLADNTQKDLDVASSEPTYNFETDMEFLQTLPLAEGYEARINFYHPGGGPPARYTFKVAGSETIAGPAGPVDCWVVTTDYNRPDGTLSKFWFAKGSQLMLRQEGVWNGKVLVKTLIE